MILEIFGIEYFPLINFFMLIFLIILSLYCYTKVRRYLISLVVFLFSLIIGIRSMSETEMPFTPYIQVFFIVFQVIIILLMSLELRNKEGF